MFISCKFLDTLTCGGCDLYIGTILSVYICLSQVDHNDIMRSQKRADIYILYINMTMIIMLYTVVGRCVCTSATGLLIRFCDCIIIILYTRCYKSSRCVAVRSYYNWFVTLCPAERVGKGRACRYSPIYKARAPRVKIRGPDRDGVRRGGVGIESRNSFLFLPGVFRFYSIFSLIYLHRPLYPSLSTFALSLSSSPSPPPPISLSHTHTHSICLCFTLYRSFRIHHRGGGCSRPRGPVLTHIFYIYTCRYPPTRGLYLHVYTKLRTSFQSASHCVAGACFSDPNCRR